MPLTEDTNSGYSDPLEAPPVEVDNNIDRIEHAPTEENNKESSAENDDDGRLYIWLSVLVAIVGGAIIAVMILVVGGNDDDDGASKPLPATSFAPIPEIDDLQTQLDMIRSAVGAEDVVKSYLEKIPATVAELETKFVEGNEDPVTKAAAWVVLEDDYNAEDQIVERFALATIYFSTEGVNWIESDGWMTSTTLCEWYGLTCCSEYPDGAFLLCRGKHPGHLSSFDLEQNNLQGKMSPFFALLKDLHILNLSWNKLTGPLDGAIIKAMPNLEALFVQHNQLTGEFDTAVLDNGVLDTFFVQGNYFVGDWPSEFCNGQLLAFNLDCYRNPCVGSCCQSTNVLYQCVNLEHTYDESLLPSDEKDIGA